MTQIKCPNCQNELSLDEITKRQAEDLLHNEKMKITDELNKAKTNLAKEQRKLEEEKLSQEKIITERLVLERASMSSQIKKNLEETWSNKVLYLERQVSDFETSAKIAINKEIEMRTRIAEVEKKERELELTILQQVEKKSHQLKSDLTKSIADEYKRKDLERESQMAELRMQIVEWKQKAEQGSQQRQGEVLELHLEEVLKSKFPTDLIEPVPKGINGADLIHDVIGKTGQKYGRIIYEIKNTKNFSNTWISKLKEDRNNTKSDVAVLITESMPDSKQNICEIDGVWVCKPEFAHGISMILRNLLQEVSKSLKISSGRSEKAEVIYSYLMSPTFRQRMETIVESFSSMRDDLEKEKRATQRSWNLREVKLENIFTASLGIYTDIQNFVGSASFQIKALEYSSSQEN